MSEAAAAIPFVGPIVQGIKQKRQEKRAETDLREEQKKAETALIRQKRENDMAIKQANQKAPDVMGLLAAAQKPKTPSTMLTGPEGVDQTQMTLGRTKLLGEP